MSNIILNLCTYTKFTPDSINTEQPLAHIWSEAWTIDSARSEVE